MLSQGVVCAQMSFQYCVFYYWSDEEWDSCDKFREVATPILNPEEVPDKLEWRASDTQVFMKGRQQTTHRLINILNRAAFGDNLLTELPLSAPAYSKLGHSFEGSYKIDCPHRLVVTTMEPLAWFPRISWDRIEIGRMHAAMLAPHARRCFCCGASEFNGIHWHLLLCNNESI